MGRGVVYRRFFLGIEKAQEGLPEETPPDRP